MRNLSFLLLLMACGDPEGAHQGECLDNIDNDEDGAVDCEDEDCAGSSECAAGSSDPQDTGNEAGFDNVQACKDAVASMECGAYDFSTSVDCSVYEEHDCDLSEYFDCLTDNLVCDEKTGVPDLSGWNGCGELFACDEGDDDEDGSDSAAVRLCEEWLASMTCGDYDFSDAVDCSIYEEVDCDLSYYFNCLTQNTGCIDGVPDISDWGECTELAACE